MSKNRILGLLQKSAVLLIFGSLVSCGSKPVSINDVIGRYEHHSGNSPRGTTCFVLMPDGTYHLGDAKEPLSEMSMSETPTNGTWRLVSGTGQKLWIGKSSLPVERLSSSIRVTVNGDLGMYCDLPMHK